MPSHSALTAIVTVLISLVLSRTAASAQSTLSRRSPVAIDPALPVPKTNPNPAGSPQPVSAHCGNEWNSYPTKVPGFQSCNDYAGKSLNCNVTTCHMGLQTDTPESSPLLPKLFFVNCIRSGDPKRAQPSIVYALSYTARNRDGTLVAAGFPLGDSTEEVYHYRCPWQGRLDWNNQRVWCKECHPAPSD